MAKKVIKINEEGFILCGQEMYFEPKDGIYEIPEGYVDAPLPTDDDGHQLPFWRPRWTGTEWVEDKSQSEFEEDAFIASLTPSAEEITDAEFEIKILNILLEVELI